MYLIKLKIEMNMSDLIVKIVKATAPPPNRNLTGYRGTNSPIPVTDGSRQNSDSSNRSNFGTCSTSCENQSQPQILPAISERPTMDVKWDPRPMPADFDVDDVVDRSKIPPDDGISRYLPGTLLKREGMARKNSDVSDMEMEVGYGYRQ